MIPVSFPQINLPDLKKPQNMTDEECGSLPICLCVDTKPKHFVGLLSCWKFSKEDLEEIQKTGVIWVRLLTYQHPAMEIFTENPFDNNSLKTLNHDL